MLKLPSLLLLAVAANANQPLTLWYRQPAAVWTDALPVGNGRLGAMAFGRPAAERIQFNESTIWTGEPHDYTHAGAAANLPEIRSLLFQGKQKEAEDLAGRVFMSVPLGQKSYQAFGDVLLDFPGIDASAVSAYRRDLDLDKAVAGVTFTHAGVIYRREVFASYPARAIVIRLSASRPRSLTFSVALQSAHPGSTIKADPNGNIVMAGAPANSAIRFEARLRVVRQGGSIAAVAGRLGVKDADSVLLVLTGATNFRNYRDVSADPAARNAASARRPRGQVLGRPARRAHRRPPAPLPPRVARSRHHARRGAAHRRAHRGLRRRQRPRNW